MFDADVIVGPLDRRTAREVIDAKRAMFSMIDDDLLGFVMISIRRSLKGRPSAGLFLRPQSCFEKGLKPGLKYILFATLKHLPYLTILTITPFEISPKFKNVANAGVYDPQYWDLVDTPPQMTSSHLPAELPELDKQKKIVCMLGTLSIEKGLALLLDLLEAESELLRTAVWICAGRAPRESKTTIEKLVELGVIVIDRFLSDKEILSLTNASDFIWAAYSPSYDQASGIFGRGIQMKKVPIVRTGSMLSTLAENFDLNHVSIDVRNNDSAAAKILKAFEKPDRGQPVQVDAESIFTEWKEDFYIKVRQALPD